MVFAVRRVAWQPTQSFRRVANHLGSCSPAHEDADLVEVERTVIILHIEERMVRRFLLAVHDIAEQRVCLARHVLQLDGLLLAWRGFRDSTVGDG